MSQKRSKERLEHMLWFMEPKLHSNFSIKLIQSILFLEHPSTIGNSIVARTRNEKRERKGWPNLRSDDLIAKVKTIMIGTCTARIAISRCIVMAVGNGAVKSNNPILFKENGGSLQLTEDRARGVLRSMKWVKRKGTTWETEPSQQFLLVEKLTFQKKISGAIFYHNIPKELIVNLDQIPLSYVTPGKSSFDVKGVNTVLFKGISFHSSYLWGQNSKYAFPEKSLFLKTIGPTRKRPLAFLKKFPHFKNARQTKGYPNEQMSLVIMGTLKGQDNEEVAKICREKYQ